MEAPRNKPCRHPLCPDNGPCRKSKPKKPRTPLKRSKKRINPTSAKQHKRISVYRTLRKQFLSAHPNCRAQLAGCSLIATDVHHMAGRIGNELFNIGTFLPVCRSCHSWIESHPIESKEKGFNLSRLVQKNN